MSEICKYTLSDVTATYTDGEEKWQNVNVSVVGFGHEENLPHGVTTYGGNNTVGADVGSLAAYISFKESTYVKLDIENTSDLTEIGLAFIQAATIAEAVLNQKTEQE